MYSDEFNNEEISENYGYNNEESFDNTNGDSNGSNKKKLFIVIAGIVLVIIIVIFLMLKNGNNGPKTPLVPNLIISSQRENLSIGNNIHLSAMVTNFQNAIVTWTSSNPEVATVEQNGLVTGVDYGTSVITATYLHTDGVPYTISCEVVVAEGNPNVSITDVRYQDGEIMISVGSEYNLPVIIEPSDGYITDVNYTSSNSDVVSVSDKGKIKALSPGKSVISLDFNNGQFKDEININVVKENVFTQVFIPVKSIEFTDKLLKIKLGENQKLNYQINPQNALTSYLKWQSSDESVATVKNGIVTALSEGTTDIMLTSLDGVSAIMTVEVSKNYIPVTGITTNFPSIELKVGLTSQIVANVTPTDATNKNVLYSSSDPSVASVDANGLVTANSKGTAIITLTAEGIEEGKASITTNIVVTVTSSSSGGSPGGSSGGNSSSCKNGLYASPSSISMVKDKEATINLSFGETGDKVVRCYSSNTDIVRVPGRTENTCTIKGVAKGKATVTVVSEKNNCVSVSVSISDTDVKVTEIKPLSSSITVKKGNRSSISPTILPSDATNKTISCSSSNTTVATTSVSGSTCIVYGQKVGTATITIKAQDGSSKSASVSVTVNDSSNTGSPVCTDWSKGTSEVIYKSEDTNNCNIFNVSDCTGEECTVCENKKYSYSYKFRKTDGKNYISYNKTGYNTTGDALNACKLTLASLSIECATAALNGETCEKSPVDNSCSTYPIYNRVKYTRTCS